MSNDSIVYQGSNLKEIKDFVGVFEAGEDHKSHIRVSPTGSIIIRTDGFEDVRVTDGDTLVKGDHGIIWVIKESKGRMVGAQQAFMLGEKAKKEGKPLAFAEAEAKQFANPSAYFNGYNS